MWELVEDRSGLLIKVLVIALQTELSLMQGKSGLN